MRTRVAAIVVGTLVVSSATVVAASALRSEGGSSDAVLTGTAQQTRDYYGTARASLSPMIVHVRDLPQTLEVLASGKKAPAGLAAQVKGWVEDCANARDLVNRVPVPADAAGAQVRTLYTSGAMLYTEAARLAVSAAEADSKSARRRDAELGQHLYVLADRMFDSGYRLLNSAGVLTASELHFPGPVPDFAASTTGAVPPQVRGPAGVAMADWARAHASEMATLATAVTRALAAPTTVSSADLTQTQARLAPPIAETSAQESVTGMRLAALIVGEAVNRRGMLPAGDQTTHRLELLAQRVWVSSATLIPDWSAAALALPADRDESALFVGGYFNGRPPALKPGDDPGLGLPGGLPTLDSQALLGS